MRRSAAETAVASPCTGVCAIDDATASCRGCHRTLDEIADWPTASDARRHAILTNAARRAASVAR